MNVYRNIRDGLILITAVAATSWLVPLLVITNHFGE